VAIAGGVRAVLGLLAAVLGLALAIFHWWPQISVEPSAAADLAAN
jgi:hypothetical protein